MIEADKNHVLAFLPVMIELEAMGLNPVKVMFSSEPLTMEIIEKCYIAITKTKLKYPEWYKVMSKWIAERFKKKVLG